MAFAKMLIQVSQKPSNLNSFTSKWKNHQGSPCFVEDDQIFLSPSAESGVIIQLC